MEDLEVLTVEGSSVRFYREKPITIPDRGYRQALGRGVLTLQDGCLRLREDGPVIIWPPGFTPRTSGEVIEVLNAEGQVVARTGAQVSFGGGQIDKDTGDCRGPTWVDTKMPRKPPGGQTITPTDTRGDCRHERTGEVITQVRDASGKLWDVEKRSYPLYPSAELTEGCAIPWEAKVDTGGMSYMVEYVDETGKVLHSEARPAEWVYHPESRKRVNTGPLLPDRVLRLVEYRWR